MIKYYVATTFCQNSWGCGEISCYIGWKKETTKKYVHHNLIFRIINIKANLHIKKLHKRRESRPILAEGVDERTSLGSQGSVCLELKSRFLGLWRGWFPARAVLADCLVWSSQRLGRPRNEGPGHQRHLLCWVSVRRHQVGQIRLSCADSCISEPAVGDSVWWRTHSPSATQGTALPW